MAKANKIEIANFNPRAPRGARQPLQRILHLYRYFNPRAPRGARPDTFLRMELISYFNPRAPRGARLDRYAAGLCPVLISIHVPREGHDLSPETVLRVLDVFQSTCPARGTTFYPRVHHGGSPDFNPRAPRGARPKTQERQQQSLLFQSTCPARGTTSTLIDSLALVRAISIHVPREGHDSLQSGLSVDQSNFNPRAPRGARLRGRELLRQEHQFQSTCPARGTTNRRIRGRITRNNFNPRAPRGARRV